MSCAACYSLAGDGIWTLCTVTASDAVRSKLTEFNVRLLNGFRTSLACDGHVWQTMQELPALVVLRIIQFAYRIMSFERLKGEVCSITCACKF